MTASIENEMVFQANRTREQMKTYLFYDLETTGLNKSFDQVVQFAAIRTDDRLREMDRHEIRVRLRPDVAPSPYAIITNRLSMEELLAGDTEIDAFLKIHRLLNQKDTISLGYNSLGFDDEFLRFSFYRNLLSPYTHQYANGCGRMDLFPMAVMFYLYKKELLSWPTIDGKPTLKLEYLSLENKLAQGRAHDALVDVEATVALARIFNREEKMWRYLVGFFNKTDDQDRVRQLPQSFQSDQGIHTLGLFHSSVIGNEMGYTAPVIYIGDSIPYKNQSLWLRIDLPELRMATKETIADTTRVFRKRFGEPGFILPPQDRFWKLLGQERDHEVSANINWLKTQPSILREIIMHHREFRYPLVPDIDPDAALYQNGFLSAEDQALCREFHKAPFEKKHSLIDGFKDRTTRKLAKRILFRNFPEETALSTDADYDLYLKKIEVPPEDSPLVDYRGEKKLSPAKALSEIEQIKKEQESLDADQLNLLEGLAAYLRRRFPGMTE